MKRSTTQRGYGTKHQRLRAKVKRDVDARGFICWRCGTGFPPGSPFDLGHDDRNRNVYRGPECRPCNRATKGRQRKRQNGWDI